MTRRAFRPQRSDGPEGSTPRSARPAHGGRCASPHWHTGHPTVRPGDARPAERLLRSTTVAPAAYPALLHAARVLLHNGVPDGAAAWCARLHPQAQTPAWAAAFRTLRAEALLQLGDLAAAGHEATAARDAMGNRCASLHLWPTAVHAEVLITLGRFGEAAARLDRAEADSGRSCLPLLRARGRLQLATHRRQEALGTFLAAARLARRRGCGRLPYVPWRIDIAEALLCCGRPAQARALLTEELAVPAGGPRHRAVTLRLLAATDTPDQRVRTLAAAVGEARRCKDRVELARGLAASADALDALGDTTGTAFLRRAADLAADCGLPSAAFTSATPAEPARTRPTRGRTKPVGSAYAVSSAATSPMPG
ncbi:MULTISPECIES: hypothetical protein [Streptomyces]|uniref:hypothetical protein n=1 Tax=Streptomyces TaxID=1883 RepID=UPI0016040050|nr:hypothetical protein [Streptomyces murinus]MBA9050632.1 tetratricopeptide (TPR) repeat protein [Streptomyces murinus]